LLIGGGESNKSYSSCGTHALSEGRREKSRRAPTPGQEAWTPEAAVRTQKIDRKKGQHFRSKETLM